MHTIAARSSETLFDEQIDEAERLVAEGDLVGGASRLEDLHQQALSAGDLDAIQRIASLASASRYRSRRHWRRFEQLSFIAERDFEKLKREGLPDRRDHVVAASRDWLRLALRAKPFGTASMVFAAIGSVGVYVALWGVPFLGWAGVLWPLAVTLGALGVAFDRERDWARFGLVWGLIGTGLLIVLIYITLSWAFDF